MVLGRSCPPAALIRRGSEASDVVTEKTDTEAAGDFTVSANTSTNLNYPNVMEGYSYGNKTYSNGFPIQVKQITSLPMGWDVETPARQPAEDGATEKWNNAIEYWITTTKQNPVNQANGTELMIWLGRSGDFHPYGDGIPTQDDSSTQVEIGGILWNVVGGRAQWGYKNTAENDQIFWNYIAYVPADDVNRSSLRTDMKASFDDAQKRTGACKNGPSSNTSDPSQPGGSKDGATDGTCLYPEWWVSSVQAGFEIYRGGVGLKSKNFTSLVNGVVSDRTTSDGRPVITWTDSFDITKAGCSDGGGSATYKVTMLEEGGTVVQEGAMALLTDNNIWKATINPIIDTGKHGDAKVEIKLTCGTTTTTTTEFFYVDPSGVVTNSNNGQPIQGATVTLYIGESPTGPFTVVPNGSTILSPSNRRNPDLTSNSGYYGWDVADGHYYKVRAEKAGCTDPNNSSKSYVDSSVVRIKPAVLNLNIQLNCPVQTARVVDYTDWGTGYCANVYVTNNTGAPWVWTGTFPIDGTIYNIWNATYTASNGQVTLRGINWNKTLAVGATTQSVGFCANRSSAPSGSPSVLVTKTADWGAGYCSTVTVTNNTSSPMPWNVNIPVQGTIYTSWNGVFASIGGGQESVHGVSWNATLAAGEKTHDVGFCANR
jgi:hypothetical protein